MSDDEEDEFTSSELGTKEFWTETYKEELGNFISNGDIGDIWYGEDSAIRVINWIKSSDILPNSSILDIGCGNGISLSYLADEGFNNLYGIDYCEEAITLSKAVAERRGTPIHYEIANIIGSEKTGLLSRKYDVCHDKGTFDAISLGPNDSKADMRNYIQNVHDILNDGGLFILTSCNWTESELLQRFSKCFEKKETIPSPTFEFGGKIGSSVTAIVMRKKES